jgi:hypothetical protein
MDGSLFLKIIGVALVINAIYASFAHQKEKLTIYVDWTDAGMTAATPLVVFLCDYLFITVFRLSDGTALTISCGIGAALVFLGLRVCWRANSGKGTFLVAAAAKYTMMILVYLAVGATLASGSRRKHERETTAVKRNAVAITATVAGYAAWSVWVSRFAEFSPLSNWFSGDCLRFHTENRSTESDQVAVE